MDSPDPSKAGDERSSSNTGGGSDPNRISLTIRRRVWGVRGGVPRFNVPLLKPSLPMTSTSVTSTSTSGNSLSSNLPDSSVGGQVEDEETGEDEADNDGDSRDIFDSSSASSEEENESPAPRPVAAAAPPTPRPVMEVEDNSDNDENDARTFYGAMYARPSNKKHKTWDEDGFIIISGRNVVLKSTDGKVLESSSKIELSQEHLTDCKPFRLGSKEVQIHEKLKKNPFNDTPSSPGETISEGINGKSIPNPTSKSSTVLGNRIPKKKSFGAPNKAFGSGNSKHYVNVKKPELSILLNPASYDNDGYGMEQVDATKLEEQSSEEGKMFYSAMFSKPSTKKHKTWDEDGFIIISGKSVVLKNTNGRILESSSKIELAEENLSDNKPFRLGSKEVQIQEQLSKNPFDDNTGKPVKATSEVTQEQLITNFNSQGYPRPLLLQFKREYQTLSRPFVSPLVDPSVISAVKPQKDLSRPMFDPDEEGALVMPRITDQEVVKVVVDPHLSQHLREHQREGVEFLYKSVMGPHFAGCILADEMGLGKTLQCITLLWTLLKQSPFERKGVVKRCLIVTPSSLVSNWEREFRRWLGLERILVFTVNSDHPLKHCPPQTPVIIISYDMATRSEDALKKMKFDLLICDEAHKIKNRTGQAYVFLSKISCKRRILLTGTPVQNDLMELFALVDFANPGIVGSEITFRREFEKPIAKFQEPGASLLEREVGRGKALLLKDLLTDFFIRRSHSVMIKYLPPRITFVVVCKPTELQVKLYKKLLSSNVIQNCVGETGTNCQAPLSVILALKKICNHPNLVHPKNATGGSDEESIYYDLKDQFPINHRHDYSRVGDSGKMKVLASILKSLKGEKIVLVSHYTQTLNVLEDVCKSCDFEFKRLDGSTQSKQRQSIVDQFNTQQTECVFLLSSKAGGLGLNLQSASKIILYDIDWNPAHDIQAMARCWRPGQKEITHIYRLITAGTIEERIFHRQIMKQDLSCSVMDLLLSNSSVKFSPQDLKDIFSFHEGKTCLTHDLIGCTCVAKPSSYDTSSSESEASPSRNSFDIKLEIEDDSQDSSDFREPPQKKRKTVRRPDPMSTMNELNNWEHFSPPFDNCELEPGLGRAAKDLQFVFCSRSNQTDSDV